jgi:hypothetical protein
VASGPAKAGIVASPTTAATPAPRLTPDLSLVPDPAATTVPDVRATVADQAHRVSVIENVSQDTQALDLALWGAAGDEAAGLGTPPEFAAPHASSALAAVSSGDVAPYVLPESTADAASAEQAGLLTRCTPFDAQALEAAFQRLLDQLETLAWDFSSLLARLHGTPWLAAAAVLAVTCEVARRRLQQQARAGAALAGGAGGTLTWFPSLTGRGAGDDA